MWRFYASLQANLWVKRQSRLLFGDIASHGCFRHTPYTRYEIAPTPQRRQLRAQKAKLLPQDARGIALELCRNLGRRQSRIALDKEMHMVRHHFHGMQRQPQLLRFRPSTTLSDVQPPAHPAPLCDIWDRRRGDISTRKLRQHYVHSLDVPCLKYIKDVRQNQYI